MTENVHTCGVQNSGKYRLYAGVADVVNLYNTVKSYITRLVRILVMLGGHFRPSSLFYGILGHLLVFWAFYLPFSGCFYLGHKSYNVAAKTEKVCADITCITLITENQRDFYYKLTETQRLYRKEKEKTNGSEYGIGWNRME